MPPLPSGGRKIVAHLRPGEVVVDLGCGPGRDLLAAAGAVGPGGRVVGVDLIALLRPLPLP
ncbi:MAG: methyltransferase domain-containing protein [Actinomycetota bacterium]